MASKRLERNRGVSGFERLIYFLRRRCILVMRSSLVFIGQGAARLCFNIQRLLCCRGLSSRTIRQTATFSFDLPRRGTYRALVIFRRWLPKTQSRSLASKFASTFAGSGSGTGEAAS
jgi:hypothetical protein